MIRRDMWVRCGVGGAEARGPWAAATHRCGRDVKRRVWVRSPNRQRTTGENAQLDQHFFHQFVREALGTTAHETESPYEGASHNTDRLEEANANSTLCMGLPQDGWSQVVSRDLWAPQKARVTLCFVRFAGKVARAAVRRAVVESGLLGSRLSRLSGAVDHRDR